MPLLIKQQTLVFARWPPEPVHICLELKMWCQHANVHHPMHEFKHRPDHWNRSPDYNVSWIVCLGFIYSLPTICDTPDCLKSKNSPGGGAVWLQTPNTQHAAGPVRRKKEHNWIRYQNKVGVCFNYSSDTGSSWKLWEPAERENERKRKKWSKRGRPRGRGSEGKKGKEGSWGERTPGCGWIMRPEAGGGSCLGGAWPFRVQCQVSEPSGQWSLPLSQHRTNMSQSCSVYKSSDKGNPWRKQQPWNRLIICGGLFGSYKNTVLLLLC